MNLNAATLIETLVSISLLSLLLALAFPLAERLNGHTSPVQQYYNRALLRESLFHFDPATGKREAEILRKGRRIVLRAQPLESNPDAWLLEGACYDGTHLLERHSRIILLQSSHVSPE